VRDFCRRELSYARNLLLRLVNGGASAVEGWRRGIREREREREGKALRNYQTLFLLMSL
jgi:hypothetical protein